MKLSQLQNSIDRMLEKTSLSSDLRSVLSAAGLVMIIQVGAASLGYGSQILLARVMGPDEFGVYLFAWSWALPLATAAAVGLAEVAVRFVPQYVVKDNWGHVLGLIRRSTSMVLGAGAVVAGSSFLVLYLLENRLADVYIAPMQIAFLCVPFLTVIVLLSGVSRGFGWVALTFVPQMLLIPAALIMSAFLHVLLIGAPSATNMLVWMLVGCALITLGQSYRFRHSIPEQVLTATAIYDTRTWLRVALPLFLSDGIGLILWNSDIVMLGIFMEPKDVSIYSAAAKTAALTYLVYNAVRAFVEPKFAAMFAEHDQAHLQHFARSVSVWMFWASALVIVGVAISGDFILSIFGSEFVDGYPVLLVLCAGWLATMVVGPVGAYLSMSGHQDVVLFINVGCAILNLVLNVLLIPSFGIMGAALGTVLALNIMQATFYVFVRRRLGIDPFFLARS